MISMPGDTPWLPSEQQEFLLAFCEESYRELGHPTPQPQALKIMAELEEPATRDTTIRQIVRLCDRARYWTGAWAARAVTIRELLSHFIVGTGEGDDSLKRLGLAKPQEDISEAEVALWTRSQREPAWEFPAARMAERSWRIYGKWMAQQAKGRCDLTLETFLDLFDSR